MDSKNGKTQLFNSGEVVKLAQKKRWSIPLNTLKVISAISLCVQICLPFPILT